MRPARMLPHPNAKLLCEPMVLVDAHSRQVALLDLLQRSPNVFLAAAGLSQVVNVEPGSEAGVHNLGLAGHRHGRLGDEH